MKNRITSLAASARDLAKRDFAVVPLYSTNGTCCSCHDGADCKRPGKHPRTMNGVKAATTDPATISGWWRESPDANIGIATGSVSQILVLDIDRRHGGFATLKGLTAELGPLPKTVTSRTGGGGQHRIYQYPSFKVRSDTAGKLLGPGVDVLSEGSMFVAPPSRHASGCRYKWKTGRSFTDLQPAKLPQAWLSRLRQPPPNDGGVGEPAPQDAIPEGNRNATLTSLAGALQRGGASPEAISAALTAENKIRCSPPLDATEVEKIVKSVTRYPVSPGGNRSDDAEKLMTVVLDQHFKKGKYLIFGPDGQFWHYTDKCWVRVSDSWIRGRILESVEGYPLRTNQHTASLITQVRALLEAKLAVAGDPLGFVSDPPCVINCANGEVWIAEDGAIKLRRHRPGSYLRHCLDISYDESAKCPAYDDALLGIFAKADNPKALRRHWNELVGYLIQPRRNIPLIAILLGGGDNGKTVLARTLVKLLGPPQVQAQRVEELEKNRFAMGSLLGKRLFLDDDVRAGARLPDGILKTISEAKEVTGETKYKPSFNFVVRTVPMLLCNNIPSLADLSHGMMRRLMVVPFDRTFTDDDKNPDLFEGIWENELPGVLNRALEGYARLRRRKGFKLPGELRNATARWLEQANPVPAFLREQCEKTPAASCWMRELYPAYKDWAARAGYTMIQNQTSFRRNLEHLHYTVSHGNQGQKIKGLKLTKK